MSNPEKVVAPFTPDQVASLNGFQESGVFHPFTCGGEHCRNDLVAKEDGWHCPASSCEYEQDWAHDFMANWSWLSSYLLQRTRQLSGDTLQKVWELTKPKPR